jgi:hypothetical protein
MLDASIGQRLENILPPRLRSARRQNQKVMNINDMLEWLMTEARRGIFSATKVWAR